MCSSLRSCGVFDKLPEDAINAKIHETFVAKAMSPRCQESKEGGRQKQREEWMKQLRERTFDAWPQDAGPLRGPGLDAQHDSVHLRGWDFASSDGLDLRLYLAQRALPEKRKVFEPKIVVLNVLDDQGWQEFLARTPANSAKNYVIPSRAAETTTAPDEKAW